MYKKVDDFMDVLIAKNPGQVEFHQAVREVVDSIWDYIQDNPQYLHANILDRIVEPERILMFRVPWMDDKGNINERRKEPKMVILGKFRALLIIFNFIFLSIYLLIY